MFGHTEHHLNKTAVLMFLGSKIKIEWTNYVTHRKDNWQDLIELVLRTQ